MNGAKKGQDLTAIMNGKRGAEPWKEAVGEPPRKLWVGERPDKKWVVWVRWQENGKPFWKSLGYTIRDARGEVLSRKRQQALAEATRLQADWQMGVSPKAGEQKRAEKKERGNRPPTLSEGFTLALHSSQGMFATKTLHAVQWRGAAEDVMAALTDSEGPGGTKTWEGLTPYTAQDVWRSILREVRARQQEWEADQKLPEPQRQGVKKPRGEGATRATKAVMCLYQVSRWLHDRDPDTYPLRAPLKNWKNKLQEEWRQAWGYRPDQKEKPRHTPEELALLLNNLEKADPRVALMIELGAEQRAGQALRVTRRNILEGGGFGLGQLDLRPHGHGKKVTTVIDIHPELSRRLKDEMDSGYLAELEEAFQRRDIEDYHIFPAGRLRQGRMDLAKYLRDPKPMWQTSIVELLHEYEEACGVEYRKGRGFYGLRRLMADEAGDHTTDTRVLRQITGWKNEETRQVYLRRLNERAVSEAGEVMHRIRQKYRNPDSPNETRSEG